MSVPSQATVAAGQIQHLLLERYTYAPGPVAPLAAHAHPEYQLGLSLDSHGQYRYRGANVVVPPAHVSFVNAGEAHTPNGRAAVPTATTFHLLYIDPANFAAAAAELDRPLRGLPSFPLTSSADAQLVRSLLQLLQLGEYPTTPLDHDRRLFDTLVLLLTRFAVPAVPEPPLRAARPEVERACLSRKLLCRRHHTP